MEHNEKVIVQWGPHAGRIGYFQFEGPAGFSNLIILSPQIEQDANRCYNKGGFDYDWFIVQKIDAEAIGGSAPKYYWRQRTKII